jgi:hypothetical protein
MSTSKKTRTPYKHGFGADRHMLGSHYSHTPQGQSMLEKSMRPGVCGGGKGVAVYSGKFLNSELRDLVSKHSFYYIGFLELP